MRIIPLHSSEAFTNQPELDTNGNAPDEPKTAVNQSEARSNTTPTTTKVSEETPVLTPLAENSIDFDFIEKPKEMRSQVHPAKHILKSPKYVPYHIFDRNH